MSLPETDGDLLGLAGEIRFFDVNLLNNIAFFEALLYTTYVVIPLITSLISNPNTPFEQNRTHPCVLFCFLGCPCYNTPMEYIREKFETELLNNKSFAMYFSDFRIGVLDIETTGLSPAANKIILGGLLTFDAPGSATIEQFFADGRSKEPELLDAYLQAIKRLDVVITYNGKHFDIPFIRARSIKHGFHADDLPYDLDLYQLIRFASPLKRLLPNLKQSTVENYMGLWALRKDLINGAESVDIYNRFLRTQDPELKRQVLLHNRDDLAQLSRLLPVIEKSDLHKGLYTMGFPGTRDLHIENIELGKNHLRVTGKQRATPLSYYSFGDQTRNCRITFDRASSTFEVVFPMSRLHNDAFIDLVSLDFNFEPLARYASEESGYLITEHGGKINYMEINHFIKLFLENIAMPKGEI